MDYGDLHFTYDLLIKNVQVCGCVNSSICNVICFVVFYTLDVLIENWSRQISLRNLLPETWILKLFWYCRLQSKSLDELKICVIFSKNLNQKITYLVPNFLFHISLCLVISVLDFFAQLILFYDMSNKRLDSIQR